MTVLAIVCPNCGARVSCVADTGWACAVCSNTIRMIDRIPVFAVGASHYQSVVAGVRASHEYNRTTSSEDHLAYTARTLEIYEVISKIIDHTFSGRSHRRLTVLDVGGGRGELAFLLANTFDVATIDVDLYSVRLAQRLQSDERRFQVLCGDCSRLPLESQSVDVVIEKDTAHHMSDPKAFLAEMARVMRPDGLALIIEGVESTLVNRRKALQQDRMRQLGAEHHHFLLRDIKRLSRELFHSAWAAHVEPALFQKVMARLGCPAFGRWIDGLAARLPIRLLALGLGGGGVVFACRRPVDTSAKFQAFAAETMPMVEYPVDLVDTSPMADTVVENIQQMLLRGITGAGTFVSR